MEYLNYFSSFLQRDEKFNLIEEEDFQIIRLKGNIDQKCYENLIHQFEKCNKKKPIHVELTTMGGSLMWACLIAKVLQTHPMDVTCLVPYYALSAGTFIALACDRIEMSSFGTLGGFNPQVYGIDSEMVQEVLLNLMKNGFKESFTEIFASFGQKYSESNVESSKVQMKKILSKKYANSDQLFSLFTQTIKHDEQLTFSDLQEINIDKLINVTLVEDLNLREYGKKKSSNSSQKEWKLLNDMLTKNM